MSQAKSLCVTSFGPSGYKLYGKKFLSTFVQHVDSEIVVYVEGLQNTPDFSHDKVTYRNLADVRGLTETLNMTNFPAAKGMLWGGDQRSYEYDVNRFCRKSFAQIDAAIKFANEGGSSLYWLDADIEFFNSFDLPSLETTCMAFLGRGEVHSCASFLGWNLKHPKCKSFFEYYWSLYITGTVFTLNEWHDSYVVDWLRVKHKVPAIDLAKDVKADGFENVFDMVFKTATHKKGGLKFNPS